MSSSKNRAAKQPTTKLQRASAPVLLFIHSLPRWIFPTFTASLLLMGLFVQNGLIGGLLLIALALLLFWLVALSWSLLTPTARAMRTIVVLVTLAYAIGRMTGRY